MSGFDLAGLTPSRLVRTSAAVLAASIAGPFETGSRLAFGERLVFWAAVIGAAGFCFLLAWRTASSACTRLHRSEKECAVIAPITAALLFAAPLPPIVAWIARAAMGPDVSVDPLSVWSSATALALLIWLVQFVLKHMAQRRDAAASPNAPAAEVVPQIVLRSQLRSIADVACIEAQDHYLRVTDMNGAGRLVLYRFADAVAELKDAGEQVHRSFWVAARAVAHAERRGKRTHIVLTPGLRVPVSVSFLHAVRARGWADVPAKSHSDDLGAQPRAQTTSGA